MEFMQWFYLILADAILITHALIVLFNVASLPLIWLGHFFQWRFVRNFYFRAVHLLLIGYIAFFAFSQGAVIWVFISEVFPNRVRAKGQSLGSFSHWFMNALISGIFPLLAASSGGYPFVFFSLTMVLQFFVVLFFYPETKGVSLEQMQKKLGIA